MAIRTKKISKVRLDKTNVDSETINRALDNIIDSINPFIVETANTVNNLPTSSGPSSITINLFIIINFIQIKIGGQF